MDDIIEDVQTISANNYAYEANGIVYFDTKALKYFILLHLGFIGT